MVNNKLNKMRNPPQYTSTVLSGVNNPLLSASTAIMPPSITFRAENGGISFAFENTDGSVRIDLDGDNFMKAVHAFTNALDKSNVKYKITTTKKKKR